jgi:ABC-type dipeptide/oligopeptide/nickel transport system permease subunit
MSVSPEPLYAEALPAELARARDDVSFPRMVLRRFVANRGGLVAVGFVLLLVVVAILAPVLAPFDPTKQDLSNTFAGPLGDGHVLGTDELGRDTLSRLIFATRVALLASAQAVLVAVGLGVVPGLVAGYFGRAADTFIMRVADVLQSFVPLVLAIAIVGVLGPGLTNAMFAVGLIFAPTFVRVTRAAVLEVREEQYIEASRAIGSSHPFVIFRRVLPNVVPPILVQVSLAGGFALLAEAGLSFLGLGIQPPDSSWGTMLGRGYSNLSRQPWLAVFPGMLIALTVLAFNVIGDALRDAIGRE